MKKIKKHWKLIISTMILIALSISIIAYSWFGNRHEIARMQEIVPPNNIYLSAAHREAEINFQIGEVNTNATDTYREYVFSVSGQGIEHYVLKMAHTTNNPFTYEIYPASFTTGQPSGTEGVDYVKYTATGVHTTGSPDSVPNDVTANVIYYYTINGAKIGGGYQNDLENSDPLIADTSAVHHARTYLEDDEVQKNAEPLYWKSTVRDVNTNSFCDNYILKVDWTGKTIDKTLKETDIICLFASTSSSSGN